MDLFLVEVEKLKRVQDKDILIKSRKSTLYQLSIIQPTI